VYVHSDLVRKREPTTEEEKSNKKYLFKKFSEKQKKNIKMNSLNKTSSSNREMDRITIITFL